MKTYTNRTDFPEVLSEGVSSYCPQCHGLLGNKRIKVKKGQVCSLCNQSIDRVLVWGDKIAQYFNEEGTLIHKTVGVFLVNEKKEIFLFNLTKFPYGYTVPAGHVDQGEDIKKVSIRELYEELGVSVDDIEHLEICMIKGDGCSRGADVHEWNTYLARYDGQPIILNEEGDSYRWFSLDEIPDNVTFPVKILLEKTEIRNRILN